VALYMDIHTAHGGATVDGATQAHAADLKPQDSRRLIPPLLGE
jgi:hypothetical protein